MHDGLRRHCRACRSKLSEPRSDMQAFCSKGCWEQYLRKHCAICDKALERKTRGNPWQACKSPRCLRAIPGWKYRFYGHNSHLGMQSPYHGPDCANQVAETLVPQGLAQHAEPLLASEGRFWIRQAGELMLIDADGTVFARGAGLYLGAGIDDEETRAAVSRTEARDCRALAAQ
jgi:hypothetical protein